MESFHTPRVIDAYYGTTLVRDGFPGELEKRGFRLFDNVHTNTFGTLESMADFFTNANRKANKSNKCDNKAI